MQKKGQDLHLAPARMAKIPLTDSIEFEAMTPALSQSGQKNDSKSSQIVRECNLDVTQVAKNRHMTALSHIIYIYEEILSTLYKIISFLSVLLMNWRGLYRIVTFAQQIKWKRGKTAV
jgi:hypothetical protein